VASSTSPFPYGLSDLKAIRHKQQFFVDNTRFIPLLEQVGDENFFVRPPRFGKSVFVDTLHHYYDCATSQKEFDELFGGLDAHTNVTPLARSFHVLKFDLSTDFTGDVRQIFANNVNASMLEFRERYGLEFDINSTDCNDSLKAAAWAVKRKGGKLYVLIDEYDRFANQLLVESYCQDRARLCFSVLRSFLQTLKSIGGGQEMRSFITGIMPLALADASGYNVAVNLTHDPWFASLVGFRERDLERGLALIPHLNTAQREGALALMHKHYNGYVFYRAMSRCTTRRYRSISSSKCRLTRHRASSPPPPVARHDVRCRVAVRVRIDLAPSTCSGAASRPRCASLSAGRPS
jgi:hypothetical protein